MTNKCSGVRVLCRVWIALSCAAFCLPSTGWAGADANRLTLSELRVQRKEMAQKRRRIIYNNDGDDIGGHSRETPKGGKIDTAEALLAARTKAILGSQVDSIFYHSTRGMKIYYGAGAFKTLYDFPSPQNLIPLQNGRALIANTGEDALEIVVAFAHQHDLEIFYSNRMNDIHDWFSPEMLSTIKSRHPEYTIGHALAKEGTSPAETLRGMQQGKGPSTSLNFALPVIRDLTVEAMRQVCRNYQVDGIDLDYFRSPALFPPPVGPAHAELLNDMMRKMRKMTEEEGLRRGRPILISARALISAPYALRHGHDVTTWLREDLIDIVMPIHIGIVKRGSLRSLIALAHRHGAPAYPCLKEQWGRANWPLARGEALYRFSEEADGVTTFNCFDPAHPLWRELGDPEQLRQLPHQ